MEKPRSDVEARLAAQHRLTRELLASDTLEQAAPAYLSSVGTLLDWDAGGLWRAPQYDRMLHFVDGWHGAPVDPQILWAESRKRRMGLGRGLPGAAWDSCESVWVT